MAFDNIHLEKGMYHEAGRSFTQVLEQLDPSEGYRGTPLENTDAFQRQLKRFGIRVKGAGSDTVEKFFSTFESAVLFPEFLARAVRQGSFGQWSRRACSSCGASSASGKANSSSSVR